MRDICTVDECGAPVEGGGLCQKHYARQRRKGSTDDVRKNARGVCSVDGCDRPHQALGLCHPHWKASRKAAVPPTPMLCRHCGEEYLTLRPARAMYCGQRCKSAAQYAKGSSRKAAQAWYFRNKYGMTVEDVDALAEAGCAICETTDWRGPHGRPHVDHNHQTGQVRGVLCASCNLGLGKFGDDPARLRAAADYLDRVGSYSAS